MQERRQKDQNGGAKRDMVGKQATIQAEIYMLSGLKREGAGTGEKKDKGAVSTIRQKRERRVER